MEIDKANKAEQRSYVHTGRQKIEMCTYLYMKCIYEPTVSICRSNCFCKLQRKYNNTRVQSAGINIEWLK